MQKQIINNINQHLLPCYVDTEKASLHTRLCFISLKSWGLCLIKKNTSVLPWWIIRYLNNRTQRVKINKTFTWLRELLYGVLHASVLGPNLFKIYLNCSFLFFIPLSWWISRYLNNRMQRVKINKNFSWLRELLYGVLHGSVLGPNLFNIYLNYLFLFLNEIDVCNFDNNTTPSMCHKNLAKTYKKNLKETLN